jgi:hypothetical protein
MLTTKIYSSVRTTLVYSNTKKTFHEVIAEFDFLWDAIKFDEFGF